MYFPQNYKRSPNFLQKSKCTDVTFDGSGKAISTLLSQSVQLTLAKLLFSVPTHTHTHTHTHISFPPSLPPSAYGCVYECMCDASSGQPSEGSFETCSVTKIEAKSPPMVNPRRKAKLRRQSFSMATLQLVPRTKSLFEVNTRPFRKPS